MQWVEVDKALSTPLDIASGVPQGFWRPSSVNFGPPALYIVNKRYVHLLLLLASSALCRRCSVAFYPKTAIELEDINRISSWMQENKLFCEYEQD